MSWTDKFWTACSAVKGRLIRSSATLIEGVGSIACVVGGAGVALMSVLDESIEVSYYGGGSAQGNLNLTAGISGIGYSSEMISFEYSGKKTGTLSYNLKDYVSPDTVFYYSKVLLASGLSMRFFAANLRCYLQGRDDISHNKAAHKIDLPPPSWTEYLYVSGQSLTGSFACMCLSLAFCSTILDYSGLIGSEQRITYPPSEPPVVNGTDPAENALANTTDYQGPLLYTQVPIYSNFSEHVMFNIFGLLIKATANELVEGLGELAYGAGVYFQSNTTDETLRPSILASAPIGAGSLLFYGIFGTKASRLRDDRIGASRESKFDLPIGYVLGPPA